jgi:hypothetical protein
MVYNGRKEGRKEGRKKEGRGGDTDLGILMIAKGKRRGLGLGWWYRTIWNGPDHPRAQRNVVDGLEVHVHGEPGGRVGEEAVSRGLDMVFA